MTACSDGFDRPFRGISVLYFGLCASELSAISSEVSSEQKPIRSNFLLNKEPIALNLFTSRCIADFD
jgi:hypothetical protein